MSIAFLSLALIATMSAACKRVEKPAADEPDTVVKLVVAPVQRSSISQVLNLTGTVVALPDHSINVSPAISGKVTKLFVVPGQLVTKGQLIARLDAAQISDQVKQAQAQVDAAEAGEDQAESALKLAQASEKRMRRLVAADIGAQKDLEAAVSQLETSKEGLVAAHQKFVELKAAAAAQLVQLSYTAVRAPISGMVAARNINESEPASPTTPIVQLVDLSTVLVNTLMPPSLPDTVRAGLPATVTTPAALGENFTGFVKMISPVVDAQSQFIPIQIQCSNPQWLLKQGEPVAVAIAERTDARALVVPDTALVADPSNVNARMLYLYDRQTKQVKRQTVVVGIKQSGMTEIISGLTDGQYIVVAGAYGLPDGTKIEAQIAQVYPHTQTAIQSN